MAVTRGDIVELVKSLPLGPAHEVQERAVAAALEALLVRGQRGVVLADEVGFGKTYEALAVMTLLREHARRGRSSDWRALVLCKPSLVKKWSEEVSTTRADEGAGFPQYLRASRWDDATKFFDGAQVIERRYVADNLRDRGLRGTVVNGTLQVPPGLYVVNHDLLGEGAREGRPLLKHLYRTRWDLIIVDEAHHYAKGNRPSRLFAPHDGDLRNYEQGIGDGHFEKILALTATPFELTPHEIVKLLALVRADKADLALVDKALSAYVRRLDRFFDHRQRSPSDTLRSDDVAALKRLRLIDATGAGAGMGLEALLRRYLIRNTKSQQERRYFFVNKVAISVDTAAQGGAALAVRRETARADVGPGIVGQDETGGSEGAYQTQAFNKLDDLRSLVALAPLIPFDGPDALFYLQLRRVIQETADLSMEHEDVQKTFITTDLRQGLSSYPQIAASSLLQRDMDSAKRLKQFVDRWVTGRSQRLHPKVRAVTDLIRQLAVEEVEKLRTTPGSWLSKVLVFNKLIRGTAPQLREQIEDAIEPVFTDALLSTLRRRGLGTRDALAAQAGAVVDRAMAAMAARHEDHVRIPMDRILREDRGRSIIEVLRHSLRARSRQTLFLLHAATQDGTRGDEGLAPWMKKTLLDPLEAALGRIVRECMRAGEASSPEEQDSLYERAERDTRALLEEHQSVRLVGRYDGDDTTAREAHRRNFNLPYNPFVLLVSRVGEEGIDLQKQCRYIIHYDLEWNPAKMEQREGRVDRVGWGRSGEKYIDVRFLLLKGTYEERIFHTVMQRDQWFQILIGSKRRELGRIEPDESESQDDAGDQESFVETHERGQLTEEECRAVMLNLAPAPTEGCRPG